MVVSYDSKSYNMISSLRDRGRVVVVRESCGMKRHTIKTKRMRRKLNLDIQIKRNHISLKTFLYKVHKEAKKERYKDLKR